MEGFTRTILASARNDRPATLGRATTVRAGKRNCHVGEHHRPRGDSRPRLSWRSEAPQSKPQATTAILITTQPAYYTARSTHGIVTILRIFVVGHSAAGVCD